MEGKNIIIVESVINKKNSLDSTRTSSNRWYEKHIPDITKNTREDGHNEDFNFLLLGF